MGRDVTKIVSEYDQEIPQSQTADNPMAPCLPGSANNNGVDQPAHPRSLISAFVFGFLERIISKLVLTIFATSEFQFF